jgi:ABC-type sugar transport system permease subunit
MPALPVPRPRRMSPLARREARWGLLFLSPWVVGFLAFIAVPMIATLAFTFTNLKLTQTDPLRFVGLDNYAKLISDPQTWDSLRITLTFAALQLPIAVLVPFAVALMLNSRSLRGSDLFRVLWFLPYVVPFVAGVLIWQSMLNPDSGWLDQILEAVGVTNPPNWLNDPGFIFPGLLFIGIWGIGGGIIVNLAGLKGIPSELYDAAAIDGAGWLGSLRHVTVPLMSPVFLYVIVLGIVDVLQYFLVPLVLNNGTGEPGGQTLFYNLQIYKTFFTYQDMSYGATLAWLLFAVTLVISLVVFRASRRWVYYAAER